jgi:hypothetical protein
MEDIGRVNALPLLRSFGIRELRMRRLREMVRSVVAHSGQPILVLAGTPPPELFYLPRHVNRKLFLFPAIHRKNFGSLFCPIPDRTLPLPGLKFWSFRNHQGAIHDEQANHRGD